MTVPLDRAQADLCRIPRPLAHASGVCPVWSLFLGLLPKSAILHLCRAFTSARSSGRRGRSPSAFAPATVLLAATCFGQRVGAFAIGYLNDVLKEAIRRGDGPLFAVIAALTTVLKRRSSVGARGQSADIKRAPE
jgi:hypothetical protein